MVSKHRPLAGIILLVDLFSGTKDNQGIQDDLAKALKIKQAAPPKPDKKGKADPLEVMSQIRPGEGKDAIKKKLVTSRLS